jgi:exopolyphosphatase/guanosine-5'-triphosphate,3'-diphosphate pyrophosphatase
MVKDLPVYDTANTPIERRAMERVGVIDVGSNSVRLVVFDGAARSPAYFFNEKILCGLGRGLSETGRLDATGRDRALQALKRFAILARGMDVTLTTVATAAVREAEDGPDFCDEVLKQTGLSIRIASGKEEARLSAQGVVLGWPDASGLVCDIGGASLELAEVKEGRVSSAVTSSLGPLKLESMTSDPDELRKIIRSKVKKLRKIIGDDHKTLYLVGGSWRAIARLNMVRVNYPLLVLHEYQMRPEAVEATLKWIGKHSVEEMRALSGSSEARLKLVPTAALVLKELMSAFGPKKIAVSSYGIREGLLYENMPQKLRDRDPLLEACWHMEAAAARVPGFGQVLYEFLKPVFKGKHKGRMRLIKAACYLHDVTWRAHPDYRAEVCFDNATRSNLGGLDHPGRVFLGTCLLHRYKNSREGTAFEELAGLLKPDDLALAEVVGKAMRFGAMLSGSVTKSMGKLKLHKETAGLELTLNAQEADLLGEVVVLRFESLARVLGCTTQVTIPPKDD